MRFSSAPSFARAFILLAASAGVVACSGASSKLQSNFAVPGYVIDPAGKPVSGASVHFGDRPLSEAVLTDAQGHFALNRNGGIGDAVVIVAQNANFTTATRRQVLTVEQNTTMLMMRLHDVVQTIALPGPTDPAVVVQAASTQGLNATLTVPPGSLLLPNGTPATGQATVRFSYWHPQDDRSTAPALLYSIEADGSTTPLDTFGMYDLSADQNGQQLTIAASSPLVVTLPITDQQAYAIRNKIVPLPNAYVVDPATGLWTYVIPVTAAAAVAPVQAKTQGQNFAAAPVNNEVLTSMKTSVYYDGPPPTIRIVVLKFFAGNIDYSTATNSAFRTGGCVDVQVLDGCTKKPVAKHPVNLRVMNVEEVAYYFRDGAAVGSTAISGANGHVCINVPQELYASRVADFGAHYYLFGKDLNDTRQCRQYGNNQCYLCPNGVNNYCSNCRYAATIAGSYDPAPTNQSLAKGSETHDTDLCELAAPGTSNSTTSPLSSFLATAPCHFCPDQPVPGACIQGNGQNPGQPYSSPQPVIKGGCTLLTLLVSTSTCNCTGHAAGVAPKACTPSCITDHQLGTACDGSAQSCCQANGQANLVCRDDVCVDIIYAGPPAPAH
jgi:hypothetical protein